MSGEPTHFYWIVTDEVTKRRRRTRYRMTEAQARESFGADAVKVEWSGVSHQNFGQAGDMKIPSRPGWKD